LTNEPRDDVLDALTHRIQLGFQAGVYLFTVKGL